MARDGSPKPLLASTESVRDDHNGDNHEHDENAPLLANRSDNSPRYNGENPQEQVEIETASSVASGTPVRKAQGTYLSSISFIIGLCSAFLVVVVCAFIVPATVEEYGKRAIIIEPKGMSIDGFTRSGVRARVQAEFHVDADRCENRAMRTIGRLGMYLVHMVESDPTDVYVYLPEYDNLHVGTAKVPKMTASVRNGEVTHLDFLTDVSPGKITDIQRIADDWLKGRMGQLTVRGKADVPIKRGWIPLGTSSLAPTIVLEGSDLPGIPTHNITKLNIHEADVVERASKRNLNRGMVADATVVVENEFPFGLTIPPLAFDMLVGNCVANQPHILVAESTVEAIEVQPKTNIEVKASALVQKLRDSLTKPCPLTELSPLDTFIGDYIGGKNATVYIRGAKNPHPDTPDWIAKFMSTITIPIPVEGKSFDGMMRDFDIQDVHFSMPNPFADPNSPDSNPRISGNIIALVALPQEMNFNLNVTRIRATADVFHEGKKLGVMNLKEWQKAKSKRIDPTDKNPEPMLQVSSKVKDAPLNITDQDVFSDLVQKLLFGDGAKLDIKALADMEVKTVLGALTVKGVSGEGSFPVKAPSNGSGGFKDQLGCVNPRVYDLQLVDTGKTSLTLEVKMNFTNPTNYTATVPYFNIFVMSNGSVLGEATVRDMEVRAGNNSGVARILWNPVTFGDKKAPEIGRNLLSQYISGWNTTMTFKTHAGSVPNNRGIGEALSKFPIEMSMPHLSAGEGGGDGEDGGSDRPHFIQSATIHLFSSTAVFGIQSPFQHTAMWMEAINATAFYNHTEVIGEIMYDLPFKIPPGTSDSPRLPVDWDPSGVGYQRMKEAINGGLKVAAKASTRIRLGEWRETVWFEGDGIGAKVRL